MSSLCRRRESSNGWMRPSAARRMPCGPNREDSAIATDNEPFRLTLTMSPALNAQPEQLALANCATKAELLRKAIALYEVAYRASLKD